MITLEQAIHCFRETLIEPNEIKCNEYIEKVETYFHQQRNKEDLIKLFFEKIKELEEDLKK